KNDKIEVWFKQDDQFFTPHGHIGLSISSESIDNTALNHLLTSLLCELVSAELQEQLHSASIANSKFGIAQAIGSINIDVSGFSSGLPHLLKAVLQKLRTFVVDAQQFSIYLAKVERKIQSRRLNNPMQYLYKWLDAINMMPAFDQDMLEEALKEVTLDGLQAHFESVLSKAYVKMLVSGNYTQSVALDTSNQVLDILQHQPTPRYLINAHRSLDIEPGYFVQNVPISDEKCLNSAVVSTFYCGSVSDTRDNGESNPVFVTQRIDQFIRDYRQKLQEMTVEEFESSVQSLISLKEEKLKSIDDEFSRLWTHINSNKYMFGTLDKEVEHLKQLGKDDLLSFWDKYFNKDTAQRYTRLDMQMWSAKLWQPTPEEFEMYPSS
ncbi:metalloprotease, partial [Coemansia sp. RSA 2675]